MKKFLSFLLCALLIATMLLVTDVISFSADYNTM